MPLATSTPTESLFVQPRSVGDPVRVTARLAPIVGLPPTEVHAALTSSRSFVWLRRKLPPAIAAAVRALREPGLGFLPEPLRLCPNGELAAHVVGFEGVEGGLEGIERVFDAELAGTPGKAIVGRDALGREVAAPHVLEPPQPGHGVMLTIDRTIQYIAEREIDAAYRRTGARSAMAVGLPGESRGLLRAPGRWSLLSLPTMSIGQEISVTALQMVAAVGAVANGGTLVQPRIVGATFDAEGQEIRRFEPAPVRQVISPETARVLTRILVRAVESGTGHNAAIAGYEVAGKTGTAQKLDPATRRYSRAPGVLSFVGWAPADEPRFVMLVTLDEPRNEQG